MTRSVEFDYNKLSQRTKLTYENGVETDYGFETDGDMDSLIQTFTGSSVEFTYAFNNVHELTSQEVDDSAYMWHPASAGTVTYAAANNMNQYPTVGGTTFAYDNNGCLTDDGVFDYTYDTENQLIEADDGSTVSSYIYDPMRRQNQKNVGGTKTRYLYDALQMIAEYDGSGNIQKKYVYGPGLDEVLIELDDNDDPTYLHHDRKGSIIATSDDTGTVINTYAYSPFGESGSMSGTTFGYTGQRYDPETGLYYYKNRHYSPELGRFLQPDLIGYADGLNVYQYGYNDPNTFSDPLGLAADGSRLGSDTGSFNSGGGGGGNPGSEGSSSTRTAIAHLGFGGPALGTLLIFTDIIASAPKQATFVPPSSSITYKLSLLLTPQGLSGMLGNHAAILVSRFEDGSELDNHNYIEGDFGTVPMGPGGLSKNLIARSDTKTTADVKILRKFIAKKEVQLGEITEAQVSKLTTTARKLKENLDKTHIEWNSKGRTSNSVAYTVLKAANALPTSHQVAQLGTLHGWGIDLL